MGLKSKPPGKHCNGRNKAHTKYCRRPAGWGTKHKGQGRCRAHGGNSRAGADHPNAKHLAYSKRLPKKLGELFDEASADSELVALRDDLVFSKARIFELIERLDAQAPVELWRELCQLWKQIEAARSESESTALKGLLDRAARIISRGAKSEELYAAIRTEEDHRRKLARTEHQRLKDLRQMMTVESAMALVSALAALVNEHVTDEKARRRIAEGVNAVVGSRWVM